jgi:uncharacterized lipoprotein YehR (DUF1307 family)
MNAIERLSVKTPYDRATIEERLKNFSVEVDNGMVITKDGNKVLSKYASSKIYEVVNFKDAVDSMLEVIEGIFKPKTYMLTFKAGYQELKLQGASHVINGETFHEMVWLTNSTNGMRALSVRYGLMRQICSNGAVAMAEGSGFKMKHITNNNVNEELKKFMLELPSVNVKVQIKKLGDIAKKEITVEKLADSLVNKIGKEGNETVWKMLVKKFSSSATDKIGTKEDALIRGINVPFSEMTKETLETKIPAWSVFNCYTELWRSLDASQVERETNKILEILN